MSKLKIEGNSTPVIGVKETYTVSEVQDFLLPSAKTANNAFTNEIKWFLYVLDRGNWRLAKGNEKTGETSDFTFTQKSLKWKEMKLIVHAYGQKAMIEIKPQKASEGKILFVELLDNNLKIPSRPFAYGDWIVARVHCVDMEFLPVKVILWEDDGGKTKQNTSNLKIDVKEGDILNGKADVAFYLNPSHAWLADAKLAPGDKNEGEFHEYYVTAEIFEKVSKRVPSKNTNVPNQDYKPAGSLPGPKKQTPAEKKGPSKKETKKIAVSDKKVNDYHEQKVAVKKEIWKDPFIEKINSLLTVNIGGVWGDKKVANCGEKYCIKKGDKSELIREINIRLAGFGGNVPTDVFTDRTEKMIKQFQRDYMKVPETGKVCGNVLRAIDDFSSKWEEKIFDYTCLCKNVSSIRNECSGFGKGRYKGEYVSSSKIERYHKYERPGIHRSLLWGVSALRFYLSKQNIYNYLWKTAGYRCWEHNNSVPRKSTNHMGKAVDIQFSKNGQTIEGKHTANLPKLNEIYNKFYAKYLDAKYQWVDGKNNFSIEPIGMDKDQTYSWIHLDVREFDNEYLDDKYFIKSQEKISNGSVFQLALKLGLINTCNCSSGGNNSDKKQKENCKKGERVDPKKLKLTNKGKQFIKDWEEFKPNLYNDDSKNHHCTIGYGHLVHLGPCNGSEPQEFKNGITEKRALELFDLRIVQFEKAVQRDVTVPLYQYEFDALVSFLFNCGENFFVKKKAPKLHKHLLNKEYDKAAEEFLDVTSGGLKGLVKRRKAENNIFLNDVYDSKH